MAKKDKTQVERMITEIDFILRATSKIDVNFFLKNDLLQHGVTMSFITIGECANHLSDDFKEKHKAIEWHKIIAVRNIAAHGYWQLNMKQIWQAVINDIPKLERYLKKIIERYEI